MFVPTLRLTVFLFVLFATTIAQAQVVFFDSSFKNPDFVDSGIGFGGENPDTIIGQAAFQITDASGIGILNGGNNFQRALFGWKPADAFDEDFINSTNDEIVVSALGLEFNPNGKNVGLFGLSNVDADNPLGGSKVAAGVQFTWDGTHLYLDRNIDFKPNLDVKTEIGAGVRFDYTQRFSPKGGGKFDIKHYINGKLAATSEDVTPNFDKSSSEVTGYIQDCGEAGKYSVDALKLSGGPSERPE